MGHGSILSRGRGRKGTHVFSDTKEAVWEAGTRLCKKGLHDGVAPQGFRLLASREKKTRGCI